MRWVNKSLCVMWVGENRDMKLDWAAREVLEYGTTPHASTQIDRCVVKFPMGRDRIAVQENKQRETERERETATLPSQLRATKTDYNLGLHSVSFTAETSIRLNVFHQVTKIH